MLDKWTRDDQMELAANPDYRNFNPLIENPGQPHIDRLILRTIPDAVARMAALRSGEVDMAEPSLEEAGDLRADADLRLYAADRSGQLVFWFSYETPDLVYMLQVLPAAETAQWSYYSTNCA